MDVIDDDDSDDLLIINIETVVDALATLFFAVMMYFIGNLFSNVECYY